MYQKLLAIAEEYERRAQEMVSEAVLSDSARYRRLAKAQAEVEEIVRCFRHYQDDQKRLKEAEAILREEEDPALRELAEEDKRLLTKSLPEREKELRRLLVPKDPNDEKNTIVEIRAGTGGEEAALFAADLYRMYSRFAETQGWKVEVMNSNPTGLGGFKEVCFKVSGQNVYSRLKFEGGVHRVQRVPVTEAQGRIHTSAVTVAVLPEADEIEVDINPEDLHIDVFRSTGPGGQGVNTTDSAVRIVHKPTGLVVTCRDERSQHKNKARALEVLRARLYAQKQAEEDAHRTAARRSQVRSGDRSDRVRTYNFPQNRLTDHRIHLTLYRLDRILEGDLQEVIDALSAAERAEKMAMAT